ncbi:MAG: hypothetical protein K8R88_09920 [Armatimonadetes bacterium]|nr:hypothetical protein [Armatimonadota bacterium]
MKDNKLDQLINSAFGELSADQSKELLSSLSAAESKEYADLTAMRVALSALPEPGECQVSTEMLRDRILGAGVAMRKPFQWKWITLALPGVAAVFVATMFLNNPKSDSTLEVPVKVATITTSPEVIEPTPMGILETPSPSTHSDGDPDVAKPAEQARRKDSGHVTRKALRRGSVRILETDKPNVAAKAAPIGRSEGGSTENVTPAPSIQADSLVLKPNSPETVVVISEGSEGPAGTQVAEEVNSSSDVIING